MSERTEKLLWVKHPDELLEFAIQCLEIAGDVHDCSHCPDNAHRIQTRWDQLKTARSDGP